MPTEQPVDHAARIAEIRRQLEAATPGPWEVTGQTGDHKAIFVESDMRRDNWNCCRCEIDSDDCNSEMAMANAVLIAAAPENIQYLLNRVAELEAEVQRLTGERTEAERVVELIRQRAIYTGYVMLSCRLDGRWYVGTNGWAQGGAADTLLAALEAAAKGGGDGNADSVR